MMLRGREDCVLRVGANAVEEGRTPGVVKRFGATKDFLVGRVR